MSNKTISTTYCFFTKQLGKLLQNIIHNLKIDHASYNPSSLSLQCDQISKWLVQYLAIYKNANLPNIIKSLPN